jgi:hypothetical protein
VLNAVPADPDDAENGREGREARVEPPAPVDRISSLHAVEPTPAGTSGILWTCPRTSMRLTPQRSTSVPAGSEMSDGPM